MTNTVRTIRTVAPAARFGSVTFEERIGVVVSRSEYVRPRLSKTFPLIGTSDENRIALAIRFDGGLQDFKAVDQIIDAESALVKEGDQVIVTIVDDAHISDTVRGTWTTSAPANLSQEDIDGAKVLRQAEYTDAHNRRCIAKLMLINRELVCIEEVAA